MATYVIRLPTATITDDYVHSDLVLEHGSWRSGARPINMGREVYPLHEITDPRLAELVAALQLLHGDKGCESLASSLGVVDMCVHLKHVTYVIEVQDEE